MLSTILSILLFSELIYLMLYYFGVIYSILIFYLFLFFLGVLRMREECIKESPFLDFIKMDNLYRIKLKRKECTLLGIFISRLYEYINSRPLKLNININKLKNIYYCIDFFFIRNYKDRLFAEKIFYFPTKY